MNDIISTSTKEPSVMALEPHAFMNKMSTRIGFTSGDRALLQANSEWGLRVGIEMADHFYAYLGDAVQESLGRICMIALAFIEQAYVEVSSAAVLKETGWTEGLFKRLIATDAHAM